jgi:2'-hydroxyisoflavone reductase
MGISRAVFSLALLLLTAALVSAPALARQPADAAKPSGGKVPKPLKLVILGGTNFLGPAIVDSAKARGHSVTIFNRGKTEKQKGAIDGVEHLFGNRDPNLRSDDKDENSPKGLTQLEKGEWDVVIDTSGYVPRIVKASAELLAPRVKQYIFISTVSVYARADKPNEDETAALLTMADPTDEKVMGNNGQNYGGLKALCEQAAEAAMPGRSCSIRPGFIVGPGDGTDRFTYWPVRAGRGGEMLAPGTPLDPVQVIDVRDLADFVVLAAEQNLTGNYNALGNKMNWGQVLQACVDASKLQTPPPATPTTLTWVDADWLEKHKIGAGPRLPIWVPPAGEDAGFHTRLNSKAVAAGLKFRPLRDTIDTLLAWWPKEVARRERIAKEMQADPVQANRRQPKPENPGALRAGLTAVQEAEALAMWHKPAAPEAKP